MNFTNLDSSFITIREKTITLDSGEQLPNNIVYELVLNTNKLPVAGQKTRLKLTSQASSPPVVPANKVVRSVDFGKPNVSANGERRIMKVYGDVGAKVNIGIYTDTGTVGTQDGSESADIVNISDGELISATNLNRGQGVFTFTAVFPFTSVDKNYGLQISAGTSSALNVGANRISQGADNLYDYTFQQFKNPTITINATTTGSPSYDSQLAALQITRVGVANTRGSDLNHIKNKSDIIPINWTLTGVTGTLSNPKSIILDNNIITDGVFENGLTSWSSGAIVGSTVRSVTDTVNGNYIDRTPQDSGAWNISQTGILTIGRTYNFILAYSGQSKAGGEITISAGETTSSAQALATSSANVRNLINVTLTCAGNTNLIINANADVDARIHSITTSSFTNSVPSENGGTSLRIINSSTSIDGTTVNITGSLKVQNYGNSDVTMDVDVGQLFTIS